jgi:hypothetical protein
MSYVENRVRVAERPYGDFELDEEASTSALSCRLPPLTVWNVTVCKPVGSITFLFCRDLLILAREASTSRLSYQICPETTPS